MIVLIFALILGALFLLLRESPMSDEDYELYFRTNVMGMTKSNLLSMETYHALQEKK